MPRAVVLLHRLHDGSAHYDLLLAPDGPDDEAAAAHEHAGAALVAFRCSSRPDDPTAVVRGVTLERIADHRRAYLTYVGPISGGRGEVSRVAAGVLRWRVRSATAMEVEVSWNNEPAQHVRIDAAGGNRWRLASAAH